MNILDKKIMVMGIGYIGLPTAAIYAKTGFETVGFDLNEKVVNALNEGKVTIEEPHLDDIVAEVVKNKKLRATNKIEKADVFFISVPTPIKEDYTADIRYIESACNEILKVLEKGNIVVLESTSPPKTTTDVVCKMLEKSGLDIGKDVFVAHTPERVIPGRILQELIENNRIVGGINEESSQKVVEIFKTFVKGEIFVTDATTAEMCKVMENTYRDVNIAFANEMALICEKAGISAWEVRKLANFHPRVNIHMPGPGVGGHCIAVDPYFLIEKFQKYSKIISIARAINTFMPVHTADLIKKNTKPNSKIAVLGVTFKPNVDDIRESPIFKIIDMLKADGYEVAIHDPHAKDYNTDINEVLKDAGAMLLAVDHDRFKNIDFDKAYALMKEPVVVDTRGLFEEKLSNDKRFKYVLLGKGYDK